MPTARVEYGYPGGPITCHFAARFGPDDKLIATFTMTGPSARAVPAMLQKAVARMDRLHNDAQAAGVLRTARCLVLAQPAAREELPEETTDQVPAGGGEARGVEPRE